MNTIIVAPHPDDEVLGVGGTILRRKSEGDKVAWLIITGVNNKSWGSEKVQQRAKEIEYISKLLQFDEVFELNFPAAQLDTVPMSELIGSIGRVFKSFEPSEIFVPHFSDIHSDHRVVFDAIGSCVKWFRYPSIKRVLAYETLSETDFGLGSRGSFRPNIFFDIEPYLDIKIEALKVYTSEVGNHPFPRSVDSILALAILRGAASGFAAAEAFELIMERIG